MSQLHPEMPRFYLTAFAHADFLWRYEFKKRRAFCASLANVGYATDYASAGEMERRIAEILKGLEAARLLSPIGTPSYRLRFDEKLVLANFIAVQTLQPAVARGAIVDDAAVHRAMQTCLDLVWVIAFNPTPQGFWAGDRPCTVRGQGTRRELHLPLNPRFALHLLAPAFFYLSKPPYSMAYHFADRVQTLTAPEVLDFNALQLRAARTGIFGREFDLSALEGFNAEPREFWLARFVDVKTPQSTGVRKPATRRVRGAQLVRSRRAGGGLQIAKNQRKLEMVRAQLRSRHASL